MWLWLVPNIIGLDKNENEKCLISSTIGDVHN
jgi:hypothetical protein